MTKLLKITATGCTGGFSSHPDLQARFMAWLVFSLLSFGAFAFDAWISYSVFADYLAYIGTSGHWPGLILSTGFALAATVSVSVVAYAFVTYRRSLADLAAGSLSDSLRFAGYIAAGLYLAFACISLLANVQGAQRAAELHATATAPADDTPLTKTAREWTAQKEATAARYTAELAGLAARIAAVENGSTKEQGRYNGRRGNAYWQGKLTPYGRALLADLRDQVQTKERERAEALAALDATYKTRLDTEKAQYSRRAGRQEEKKARATSAIRLIVFLIYPIALMIAVFNAHFLIDATAAISGKLTSSAAPQGEGLAMPAGYQAGNLAAAPIGYKKQHKNGMTRPNFDQMKEELLREITDILEAQKVTALPVKGDNLPPLEYRFTSDRQPARNAPKKHGKRADSVEARTAILSAHRAIKAQGKRPTYQAISKATGYSIKTVGNHVRELKREKVI